MNKYVRLAGRIALVAACLAYVFWDLDFRALWRALAGFNPWGVLLVTLAMWASFVGNGLRLKYLTSGRSGFVASFNAEVLGLGLSNILPAKGGEVAKALYLRRGSGMTFSRSLSVVFWERFFDLNAVCVLGFAAAVIVDNSAIAGTLGALTLGIWTLLVVIKQWPAAVPLVAKLLIFKKLKLFFTETLDRTAEGMRLDYLAGAALLTLPPWICYYFEYHFLLFTAAEFPLTLTAGLSVFVLGALGLAAPSTPGGLGVYEAVIVAALGLYGIEKEQALAAGLVFRVTMYVPVTLYALGLLARKGLPLKSLKEDIEGGEALSENDDFARSAE